MTCGRELCLAMLSIVWLGCSGQAVREDTATSRGSVTRDSAETARAAERSAPSSLTGPVTLTRSGGLAGRDDQVVIYADGRVRRLRGDAGVSARVSEETLARLSSALAAAATVATSDSAGIGADRLVYIVEYGGRRLRLDAQTADGRLSLLRDLIQSIFGA